MLHIVKISQERLFLDQISYVILPETCIEKFLQAVQWSNLKTGEIEIPASLVTLKIKRVIWIKPPLSLY